MQPNSSHERGFSIVEIIIIITLLAAIALAAWMAFGAKQESQQATSPTPTAYLSVADWKIQVPLNTVTSPLKAGTPAQSAYSSDPADASVTIIAPTLDSSWTCAADPKDSFKGTIGSVSRTKQTKRPGPYESAASIKLGDYTYGFEPGGSNCTTNPDYQALVESFKAQFSKARIY